MSSSVIKLAPAVGWGSCVLPESFGLTIPVEPSDVVLLFEATELALDLRSSCL